MQLSHSTPSADSTCACLQQADHASSCLLHHGWRPHAWRRLHGARPRAPRGSEMSSRGWLEPHGRGWHPPGRSLTICTRRRWHAWQPPSMTEMSCNMEVSGPAQAHMHEKANPLVKCTWHCWMTPTMAREPLSTPMTSSAVHQLGCRPCHAPDRQDLSVASASCKLKLLDQAEIPTILKISSCGKVPMLWAITGPCMLQAGVPGGGRI